MSWTEAQDDFLRSYYPKLSFAKIGRLLGKSPVGVWNRARRLGMVKSPQQKERESPKSTWEARKCLCCGQKFQSSWIGNRMCLPCKDSCRGSMAA